MEKRIFVISRDNTFLQDLKAALYDKRIHIHPAESVIETGINACGFRCDLIIVDMPVFEMDPLLEITGIHRNIPLPVLVLHETISVTQKVLLYHSGASVLLEKRTAIELCAAQVQALLRLCTETVEMSKSYPLLIGTELMIDPSCRIVKAGSRILDLTRREFDLMLYFAQNQGRVFSPEQLYREIWGNEMDTGKVGTVKVHICTLRKKLSIVGKDYIQNMRGVGYRFIPPKH